jgi:hypothetical protein
MRFIGFKTERLGSKKYVNTLYHCASSFEELQDN